MILKNKKSGKSFCFSQLDIFGSEFNFLTDGNEKFKSDSGALLTVIYCIIVIALFFGFGLDLYQRKNPRVSFNTETVPYFLQEMSNANFTYAFRVEDNYGLMVDKPNLLYPVVGYVGMELKNGTWSLKIGDYQPVKKCHEVANYTLKESYYNVSLLNWYCLDFDGKKFGGNWNGNFAYYFMIQILQCTNSTQNNNTCLRQEEIEKNFVNEITGSNLFYSDLSMNIQPAMNNFTSPLSSTLVNNYEMLNLQFTRRKVQTFKTTKIDNDVGWFFSDFKQESLVTMESIRPDFTLKDKWNQNVLYNTFIYLGNTYDTYNRSYTKVQEVIASIGGFAKFFHTVLFILHFSIGKVYKNLILIQAIPFNEDSFNLQPRETSPRKNNAKVGSLVFKKFEIRKTIERTKNFVDIREKVNYLAYFKRFVCKCGKNPHSNDTLNKYKYYDKYFTKALDVISYINLYNQFKLLKQVLMDENQLMLFQLLKPELKKKTTNRDNSYDKLFEYLNSLQSETSRGESDIVATQQKSKSVKKNHDENEKIRKNMFDLMDRATKNVFNK
jgi:hypothetical protein